MNLRKYIKLKSKPELTEHEVMLRQQLLEQVMENQRQKEEEKKRLKEEKKRLKAEKKNRKKNRQL